MARKRVSLVSRRQLSRRVSRATAPEFRSVLEAAQLSPTQLTAIERRYGVRAANALQAHPYRLVHEIPGISFQTADTIARKLGTSKASPARLQAGILAVLQQAVRQGHTGLPMPTAIRRATRLLGVPRTVVEEYCLRGVLAGGGAFVVEQHGAETFFTSRALRHVEDRVAEALAEHLSMPALSFLPHTEEQVARVAAAEGLNAAQQQALQSTLVHPVTIVTGGPGSGKSFFCRAVATLATRSHVSLLAGAPTGRAAQRLIELTGLPAVTLHRLLDFDPQTQTFRRNADCPLDAALVLVDEVSMVDLFLFDALLAALPLEVHLVLLGDVDQLPSVGPGQVLADLIAAESVPVVRFTQIYRRAAGSHITASAHAVRAGVLPLLTDDPQAECRFIEAPDPQQAITRIVELVTDELPATTGCDPLTDIQVLCPLNQGEAGTLVLNQALQQRLNPAGRRAPLEERELRIGDRVLITQNNYRLGVFNGDAGIVVRASTRPLQVVVRTAQGEVAFIGKEVEQLILGYAVSVHKAQGGEFPIVVIFLHDLHAPLLQRTVLYTAMTRAKQRCVIVGTQTALWQAVETHHAVQRYTGFAAALQRALPTHHRSHASS
jgi:exodeoxyribonuclease V alpha subunit